MGLFYQISNRCSHASHARVLAVMSTPPRTLTHTCVHTLQNLKADSNRGLPDHEINALLATPGMVGQGRFAPRVRMLWRLHALALHALAALLHQGSAACFEAACFGGCVAAPRACMLWRQCYRAASFCMQALACRRLLPCCFILHARFGLSQIPLMQSRTGACGHAAHICTCM